MELYQIRYFLAVAETLNFTRASERSFVSQPALTEAIQRLEEAIGGRLFDRSKNSVQLTALGEAMLPTLRQTHDSANQARDAARRILHERRAQVRVGVMCTIDLHHMLPGFAQSQAGRTEVELAFREGSLESLTDALDLGDLDVGILCSPHGLPQRFAAHPLFAEDYVLAIGDDHRFNGRVSVDMAELDREHYCDRTMCEFSTYIDRLLEDRGVRLDVVQQSAREDWIQAFVRANFGVAFMPVSIARGAGLSYVTMQGVPIVREVRVLVPPERPASAALQAVIGSLTAHAWTALRAAAP